MTKHTNTFSCIKKTHGAALLAAMIASGCVQTQYVDLDEIQNSTPGLGRTVGIRIAPSYTERSPDCTIIMKPDAEPALEKYRKTLEEALGRQLSQKFTRVIDASERNYLTRRNALDLRLVSDQKALSEISNCDTILHSRLVGPGKTYLVVWTQIQIGLQVTVVSAGNQKVILQAYHMADRSEGGIPFSPLGAVVDAYSSTKFSNDQETAISVIDDAVRRIVRVLPNNKVINPLRQNSGA